MKELGEGKKQVSLPLSLQQTINWITTRSLSFPSTAAVDTGRQQLIVSTHFGRISQILCCSGGLAFRKKEEEKKITFLINRDNKGKQDFFILPLKALWNSPSVYLSGYKWSSFLEQLISALITAFCHNSKFSQWDNVTRAVETEGGIQTQKYRMSWLAHYRRKLLHRQLSDSDQSLAALLQGASLQDKAQNNSLLGQFLLRADEMSPVL